MAELDIEALKRIVETKPAMEVAGVLFIHAGAIIVALQDRERLRAAAQEVWDSIPGSFDPDNPEVKHHARALTDLGAALEGRDG